MYLLDDGKKEKFSRHYCCKICGEDNKIIGYYMQLAESSMKKVCYLSGLKNKRLKKMNDNGMWDVVEILSKAAFSNTFRRK